jgi:hypothetical protein
MERLNSVVENSLKEKQSLMRPKKGNTMLLAKRNNRTKKLEHRLAEYLYKDFFTGIDGVIVRWELNCVT